MGVDCGRDSVVSLKALTDLTEPGGAVHESQRQAAEVRCVCLFML